MAIFAPQYQNLRYVWLNQSLKPNVNNDHPTLKSWCWATLSFVHANVFHWSQLQSASSVSGQFRVLNIPKTYHSNQIYLLQMTSSVSRQFCMLSIRKTLHGNQIYLLQLASLLCVFPRPLSRDKGTQARSWGRRITSTGSWPGILAATAMRPRPRDAVKRQERYCYLQYLHICYCLFALDSYFVFVSPPGPARWPKTIAP